jgi:alpha-1,6-mannosyltransferase
MKMPLIVAALLIEASFLWIAATDGAVVPSILLLLVAIAVHVAASWYTLADGGKCRIIIPAAIVFRLTLVLLPPATTDDLYRYRWEAMVQESGGNPYQARPSAPEWRPLRDSTYNKIPTRDFKAGYGPAWELLSRGSFVLARAITENPGAQVRWMKAPAVLFDVGLLAVLASLLAALGLPRSRLLLYAWAPLPIWEFWCNGHNDAVVCFWLMAALLAAHRGWKSRAGVALGIATSVKWWPAVLLAAFGKRCGLVRTFAVTGIITALLFTPFLSNVTENARHISGFVGGWRNNDSLFGLLFWAAGGDLYRAKYMAFGCMGAVSIWLAWRSWPLEKTALWTIVFILLISANCHPWYLTWFMPLLAINPHPSLLLWTSIAPLFYAVRIRWDMLGQWDGSTPDRWWVYVPVFAVMAWEFWSWPHKTLLGDRRNADEVIT